MRISHVILSLIVLHWLSQTITPTPQPVSITAPLPGGALQGLVVIKGTTDIPGFQMTEIWYSYVDGSGMFFVNQQRAPVREGEIGVWDTTIINDGNYDIHMRVYLADGSVKELKVSGLRVRNSSPVETNTPVLEEDSQSSATFTIPAPTSTVKPTGTLLPPNPAIVQSDELGWQAFKGVLVVIVFFIVIGFYISYRKLARRP